MTQCHAIPANGEPLLLFLQTADMISVLQPLANLQLQLPYLNQVQAGLSSAHGVQFDIT